MKNNESITKRDLALRLSKEMKITQSRAYVIVQKILNYISECLSRGNRVEFRNFGAFDIVRRKARVGRNPHAPKNEVFIPEHNVVKFKPSQTFTRALNVKKQAPDGRKPAKSGKSRSKKA